LNDGALIGRPDFRLDGFFVLYAFIVLAKAKGE
jgi:hypothetical protein